MTAAIAPSKLLPWCGPDRCSARPGSAGKPGRRRPWKVNRRGRAWHEQACRASRPERRRALGGAEEQHRLLMECVTDYAIFFLDPRAGSPPGTPGPNASSAMSEAEIVGQHFSRFFTPEDVQNGLPEKELQTAATTGRANDDRWLVRKDGARLWCNGVTTALRDEERPSSGASPRCCVTAPSRSVWRRPCGSGPRNWPKRPAARTSSWRCWPTSCATPWPRSATPCKSCRHGQRRRRAGRADAGDDRAAGAGT